MNYYQRLPENTIYNICKNLSDRDLVNFMESNDRISRICSRIATERDIPLTIREFENLEKEEQRFLTHQEQLEKYKKKLTNQCSGDSDLISLEPWEEQPPNVFINFITERGRITHCYRTTSLRKWLSDRSNTFAHWIPQPGRTIDDIGHGGMPSPDERYVKLYTGEFVLKDENFDLLKEGYGDLMFDAESLGIIRLGNLKGTFGISEIHGQNPGYRVYRLINPQPLT